MAFRLTLRRPFVADHFHDLPGFEEARHGHNWEAEITVEGAGETEALAALEPWIRQVDYTILNGHPRLEGRNPTAELLALWLFEFLEAQGQAPVQVRIREKANYWASCSREAR
jgi:6-pyruvoyl-tetrahydropterin synthase